MAAGAAASPAAAQEQIPDWPGYIDGVDGGYLDARGQSEVTVEVGADGNSGAFAFEPARLWVDPGTTVLFEWTGEGGGHNVVLEDGPASLDSGDPVTNAGVNYEYTFEQGGISTYKCVPHESLGMKGGVAVGDDVPTRTPTPEPTATPEDGGGGLPGGPNGSLIIGAFIAAGALGAFAVLGADAWRSFRREMAVTGDAEPTDAPETGPTVELDHHSFDPSGTLRLVFIYLAIVVVLWVFMYFVEYLGRGLTVIG